MRNTGTSTRPNFTGGCSTWGSAPRGRPSWTSGPERGVLPRNLCRYGASFVGTDISEEQIAQARRLAEEAGLEIAFRCLPAEETDFPDGSFDVVTACQCFFYFDHALLAPRLSRILKRPGRLAALYMAWLPGEDPIAAKSEELVQRYNPGWTGGGETRHPIAVPDAYEAGFEIERQEVFDLRVPFTREGWNGRMKACRGIGASLPAEEIARFDREHLALLERIAPPRFEILHYAAVTVLRTKETGASAPQ